MVSLINKHCQSGKTWNMIELMLKEQEQKPDCIHFVLCDNSLALANQSTVRIGGVPQIGKDKVLEFSSKSKTCKTASDVKCAIRDDDVRFFLCCEHSKRENDIRDIVNVLKRKENYSFHFWMDEADKFLNAVTNIFYPLTEKYHDVELTLLTATGIDDILNVVEDIHVYDVKATLSENYHSFLDNDIRIRPKIGKTIDYVESIVDTLECPPGMVLFAPADTQVKSHKLMKNMLCEKGFAVVIVNGSQKGELYVPNGTGNECISRFTKDSKNPKPFAKQLYELYVKNGLSEYPFAITGCKCISRGITINSQDLQITHSIIAGWKDKKETVQIAGRCSGIMKHWKGYKPPIVYCPAKVNDVCIKNHKTIMRLADLVDERVSEEQQDGAIVDKADIDAIKILVDPPRRVLSRDDYSINFTPWMNHSMAPDEIRLTQLLRQKGIQFQAKVVLIDGMWRHKYDKELRIDGENWPIPGANNTTVSGGRGARNILVYSRDKTKFRIERWFPND